MPEEKEEIRQQISKNRLVTLTGVGGTGKTHLALQVVEQFQERFPNGVCLVELALLSNPLLVAQTVIFALGIRENSDKSYEDQLLHYLRSRTLLLCWITVRTW